MTKTPDEIDPFANTALSPSGVTGGAGKFVMLAFAVVAGWALFVPLGSAVIAPATLVSSTNNQLLQHINGGVISGIHAQNGDLIEKGRVILELDPALDQARLTKLRARHAVLTALRNRLEAEKAGDIGGPLLSMNTMPLRLRTSEAIDYGVTAATTKTTSIERVLNAEQVRELEKGRLALDAQLRGLVERNIGNQQQIRALSLQISSAERRVELLRRQLSSARSLVEAGHLAQQQAWNIESSYLESESALLQLRSQLAAMQGSVGETEAEMDRVRLSDGKETSQQLTEVLAELEQISDELAAAEHTRSNSAVRAPVRGHLVHFEATTLGGVVKAGETIGEIVPADAPLEVRVRVPLNQISSVNLGQPAHVRLSSLNPRIHDPVPAEISQIAADASRDEQTGERYFEVRATLDQQSTRELAEPLVPGMSGEIFIEGTARTFAAYLLEPVLDGFTRSFREMH